MKKLLVTTTALASLVAGAAFADMPSVTVGGKVDFELGVVSQKSAYKTALPGSPNQKTHKFRNRARLFVGAKGKADNGMVYGANARIQPMAEANNAAGNTKDTRTYLFFESSMGRVEMGSNFGVSRLMRVDASNIAHGTGGASDGNWTHYVNWPGNDALWVQSGDTLFARSGTFEAVRKVSWVSPRYSGFQFGLSYAPDGGNVGGGTASTYYNNTKNIWNVALNYSHTYDNMNLAFSAGYEKGKSVDPTDNDLKSYAFGGAVGTGDFTFAASYGSDGKSLTAKELGGSAKYWTAGVAYENGPFGGSLTYLHSKMGSKVSNGSLVADLGNQKLSAYSVSLDYKVAAGFKPFVEVTMYDMKTSNMNALPKNKGTVVLLGSAVSF